MFHLQILEIEFTIDALTEISAIKLISIAGITISSPDIGMGHLVRTTQLLTSLDPRYFKFKIFGQIESIPPWLDNFDYEIINFEEIDLNIINNYDLVVFDSYWNRNLLNKISTKKLIIDDLNYLGESNADIILDYNFGSKKALYFDVPPATLQNFIFSEENTSDKDLLIILFFTLFSYFSSLFKGSIR